MTDTPPPPSPPPPGYGPPGYGPPSPPPPPGDGPPTPPPPGSGAAPPAGPRGSILLGLGIGVGAFLLVWALSAALGGTEYYAVPVLLWLGVPPLLLIAGIVLAIIPRTTRTGAGLLIAVGAGVLIVGGVCIALLSGL